VLEPGATFTAEPGAELHVDAEASVELSGPEEIGAYGVALEIVDLAPLPGEPESVVANNIFHRAASFGRFGPELAGAAVSLRVNGAERAAGRWPNDLHERIVALGEILEAAGEELRRGDRIITGSIVQVPIAAGDRVSAVTGDNVVVALDIA
jgi:2-keto-4-pentenoate hydratase